MSIPATTHPARADRSRSNGGWKGLARLRLTSGWLLIAGALVQLVALGGVLAANALDLGRVWGPAVAWVGIAVALVTFGVRATDGVSLALAAGARRKDLWLAVLGIDAAQAVISAVTYVGLRWVEGATSGWGVGRRIVSAFAGQEMGAAIAGVAALLAASALLLAGSAMALDSRGTGLPVALGPGAFFVVTTVGTAVFALSIADRLVHGQGLRVAVWVIYLVVNVGLLASLIVWSRRLFLTGLGRVAVPVDTNLRGAFPATSAQRPDSTSRGLSPRLRGSRALPQRGYVLEPRRRAGALARVVLADWTTRLALLMLLGSGLLVGLAWSGPESLPTSFFISGTFLGSALLSPLPLAVAAGVSRRAYWWGSLAAQILFATTGAALTVAVSLTLDAVTKDTASGTQLLGEFSFVGIVVLSGALSGSTPHFLRQWNRHRISLLALGIAFAPAILVLLVPFLPPTTTSWGPATKVFGVNLPWLAMLGFQLLVGYAATSLRWASPPVRDGRLSAGAGSAGEAAVPPRR